MAGYGLRVSVGDTPTGTAGGPAPLAQETVFTWNADTKYFEGNLDLTGAAVDAFIGNAPSRLAYFEVCLTGPSGRDTILQTTFMLGAVVDELTAIPPAVTDQYFTKAEMLALFAKKVGAPGERIMYVSEDGTAAREMGVADDKSAIDNSTDLSPTLPMALPFGGIAS